MYNEVINGKFKTNEEVKEKENTQRINNFMAE